MLLHLECANPIDLPLHGGCRANGDRQHEPRPPAPSLLFFPARVPGRGVRRARGELGGAPGSAELLRGAGTPGSPLSASLGRCTASPPQPHLSPASLNSPRSTRASSAWALKGGAGLKCPKMPELSSIPAQRLRELKSPSAAVGCGLSSQLQPGLSVGRVFN